MRRVVCLTLAIVLTFCAQLLAAQTPVENDARHTAEGAARQHREDPESASPLRVPTPQLTFLAEKGDQRVVGTFGFELSDTALRMELSGPIGKEDTEATPLSLDGLAKGAAVEFGLTHYRLFKPIEENILDLAEKFCKDNNIKPCAASKIADRRLKKRFLDLFVRRLPIFFGATVKVSRADFSYVTPDLQTDASEKHNGVGGTASFGVLVDYDWFVATHLERQRSYSAAGDGTEICSPIENTTSLRCRTTVVGAPTKKLATLATLEVRRRIQAVGFAPRFQYRFADDKALFEVPVYFMRSPDDASKPSIAQGLNGGISVGWQTDQGFSARAFVGIAFDLIALAPQ